MRRIWAIVGLALAWVLISGDLTWPNLILALVVATAALLLVRFTAHREGSRVRILRVFSFAAWYAWTTLAGSILIARETLRRRPRTDAAIVAVPNPAENPWELAMLVNLITFVPGTIVVEVSDDASTLYVHGLFRKHHAELESDILELQQRLRRLRR